MKYRVYHVHQTFRTGSFEFSSKKNNSMGKQRQAMEMTEVNYHFIDRIKAGP